jgi:uncharacterized coiled-coil protein SlyX
VDISDRAKVQTNWGTVGALVMALLTLAGWGFRLSARVDSLEERDGTHETRIGRLEDSKAASDLHLQRLDDDMRQLLQAVERIDKNVQDLQRRR